LAAGFAASEALRATSCDAGVEAGACGSECGLVGALTGSSSSLFALESCR
jgi:hypothetical protein